MHFHLKLCLLVALCQNRPDIHKLDFTLERLCFVPTAGAHSVTFPNLMLCFRPARPRGRRPCSLMARSHACLSCVMVIGGCCKVCAVLFPHRHPSASPLWGSACFTCCCLLALMIIAAVFLCPFSPHGGPSSPSLKVARQMSR